MGITRIDKTTFECKRLTNVVANKRLYTPVVIEPLFVDIRTAYANTNIPVGFGRSSNRLCNHTHDEDADCNDEPIHRTSSEERRIFVLRRRLLQLVFEKAAQGYSDACLTKFVQGVRFDLSYAFSADIKLFADLLKGMGTVHTNTKPHCQNFRFARG